MNNFDDYNAWISEVYSIFWANGRFFACVDFSDELSFLYQDDASPMEAFELTEKSTYGY